MQEKDYGYEDIGIIQQLLELGVDLSNLDQPVHAQLLRINGFRLIEVHSRGDGLGDSEIITYRLDDSGWL